MDTEPSAEKKPRAAYFLSTFDGQDWSGPVFLFYRENYCVDLVDAMPFDNGDLLLLWEEPVYQEIKEKREAYRKRAITREEALQWILHQLQRKAAIDEYHVLLGSYWRLRRPNQPFTLGYIDAETETKAQMMEISRIADELRKIWRRENEKR